jgi:Flp pilus assembly pilin Flp
MLTSPSPLRDLSRYYREGGCPVGEIRRLIDEEYAQTTAEYALVILGAAAVAGALIAWAASGKAVKNFFTKIFDKLTSGF